jgi:hypothetical protein
MPSTIAADVRGALKTALAACTANIYDSVPEAPIVSAIVHSFQIHHIWN